MLLRWLLNSASPHMYIFRMWTVIIAWVSWKGYEAADAIC